MRPLEESLVDDGVGLIFLAVVDQLPYIGQLRLCFRTIVVVGRTAPERLLVELDLFNISTAIDHTTQMGVAYRQSLQPVGSGFIIP